MKQSVWTPEKERKLKRLLKDGALVVTLEQAGKLVDVKRYALITYCQKHDIKTRFPKVWTGKHQARLLSCVRDGRLMYPTSEVARKLGVATSIVTNQIKHQGIEAHNSAAEVKRRTYAGILALTRNGVLTVGLDIACARIGCSRHAAEDAMKDLKIRLPHEVKTTHAKRMGKPTRFTPERLARLRALTNDEGKLIVTLEAAAAELGTDRNTLGDYLRSTKVASPLVARYEWTAARRKALAGMALNGVLTLSTAKAASLLGCSVGQLRRGLILVRVQARPKTKWTREVLSSRGVLDRQGRLTTTVTEASATLGADRKSIRSALAVTRPYARFTWTPARLAQLNAYVEGDRLRKPMPEVMDALGCSDKVLKLAMKKLGIRSRPRFTWTPDAIAKLQSLKGPDGKLVVTYERAAAIIGCGTRSVESRLLGNNRRH